MSKEYNPGKIKPMIKIIASIIHKEPGLLRKPSEYLIARVEEEIPELKNKTRCANCDAPMIQYSYDLNVINTSLVIIMAKEVRKRLNKGMPFTEANQVHVPTLNATDSARHKTTDCAKLGLLAKHLVDGKHERGMWVITKRGFTALKGEEVPTGYIVWRGKIIDRPGNMTTFAQVRSKYKIKVDSYIKKYNQLPKKNYHKDVIDYSVNDWIGFAGHHDGKLF